MRTYHSDKTKKIISQLNDSQTHTNKSILPIVVVILIIIAITGFFLINSNRNSSGNTNTDNIDLVDLPPSPTPGEIEAKPTDVPIKPITGETDVSPNNNTIYYATYNDTPALYITNAYNDQPDKKEVFGEVSFGDYQNTSNVAYSELTDPIRILALEQDVLFLVDFNITDDNSSLYLSTIYIEDPDVTSITVNELHSINLETKDFELVWSRILFDESYENFVGAVSIKSIVDDTYLHAEIAECFDCGDGEVAFAELVINSQTGEDLFLGKVTDVIFDIENKKVIYTKNKNEQSSLLP